MAAISLVSAQALKVHKKNSTTPQTFQLADIDSITFRLSAPSTGSDDPDIPPGDAQYPADVFDMSIFKVTLPIGSQGSPTEIKPPDILTYVHDDYFHLNEARNGVVFMAHCGGVSTSNSGYPRSELREMTSSGDRAAWSTSSGTHTMWVKQAVTHLPDLKRHVTCAQIHGSDDDIMQIRLEHSKLFIEWDGNDGPALETDYQLGTVFTVKLVASGGKIDVYYNESTTSSGSYSTSQSGCYFKAGCYTQASVNVEYHGQYPQASEYGEVVIYDLKVTH
jgi:poly(beta-D-mannuronate) lyase